MIGGFQSKKQQFNMNNLNNNKPNFHKYKNNNHKYKNKNLKYTKFNKNKQSMKFKLIKGISMNKS